MRASGGLRMQYSTDPRSHYLKGALRCARCGSRIGYGTSKGHGGGYDYFFCLGRHTKRVICDLPYLPVGETEYAVLRRWRTVRFTDEQIAAFSERARADLHRSAESGSRLIADQRRRLAQLDRQKQKLIDAYMADALPVDALRERQARSATELADAKCLIQHAQTGSDEVFRRLEQVLALLTHAEQLYATCGPEARQLLNSAVFQHFRVDSSEPGASSSLVIQDAPLAPVVAAVATPALESWEINERTPGTFTHAEGSNVDHLAEGVGTVGLRTRPSSGDRLPNPAQSIEREDTRKSMGVLSLCGGCGI